MFFSPAKHNKMGMGLCIKDEFGLFTRTKNLWFQPLLEVCIVEALGLLKALECATLWSSDCKIVMDNFHANKDDTAELEDIILIGDCMRL